MDFVLVLRNMLGHRDLATGLVVDLRRKRTEGVRGIHREASCEEHRLKLSTLSECGRPVVQAGTGTMGQPSGDLLFLSLQGGMQCWHLPPHMFILFILFLLLCSSVSLDLKLHEDRNPAVPLEFCFC